MKTFSSLPYWTLKAILVPSSRPSKSWTLKRYLRVKVIRELLEVIPVLQILFFKHNVAVPDGTFKDCKFVWVPSEEKGNIQEPVKTFAERAGVVPENISGFWYFKRGHYAVNITEAGSQEKVLFCLHGGAYFVSLLVSFLYGISPFIMLFIAWFCLPSRRIQSYSQRDY